MLTQVLRRAASLVYPVECGTCGKILPGQDRLGVCGDCEAAIPLLDAPFCVTCGRPVKHELSPCAECRGVSFLFDRAYACTAYTGKMKTLLQAYKFGQKKRLSRFFFKKMDLFMTKHLPVDTIDAVVAVPLDRDRLSDRGFNQSALLAKNISVARALPDLSAHIERHKSKSSQSRLAKRERKQNVEGAFRLKNSEVFHGKRLLLVDDILTTGLTASECAGTLKNAGAARVTVLALARGIAS